MEAVLRSPTAADAQEVNNTSATSKPLLTPPGNTTTNYSYNITLPSGDNDWIRLTIPQVAEHVAARSGLALAPNTAGPLTRRLRWAWTGARHLRF